MSDDPREPAFFVGEIDENINLSLPPASGEEYIKRVVIEAQQCADVVVADIDRKLLKEPTLYVNPSTGCTEAPPSLLPTLEWQLSQVSNFCNLRLYVSQLKDEIRSAKRKWHPPQVDLPNIDDETGWVNCCTGRQSEESRILPTLNTMFSLNQPSVEQILEYVVQHVEAEEKIDYGLGQWIYALLVVLELPLSPDTCSCLRSLARACSIIRANSGNFEDGSIGVLNLFICLVARYFRQLDLADPEL